MMAAHAASGRKASSSKKGGVIGGIAPPERKFDSFPLMSFVKNNCTFAEDDDDEASIDLFAKQSEDAVRAAKHQRFQDLISQAAANSLKSQPTSSSDPESEERHKQALQKIHEMEWKRNQEDTWKVQQHVPKPVKEQDYGGFLRPLEKSDIGEYFSGTRKIKLPKENKRNRTVSEVQLLDSGKIMTVSGETSKNSTKQVVTNLPMRMKVSVPSQGLPFTPGPPVLNDNNVWMQRSGSELFSGLRSSSLTAYNVSSEEEEALALAIAESIRTAEKERNVQINMQQLYAAQFQSTYKEPTKPRAIERPPPDPEGTVWDEYDSVKPDKPSSKYTAKPSSEACKSSNEAPKSSKVDDLFNPGRIPSFIGKHPKDKSLINKGDPAPPTKGGQAELKLPQRGNFASPKEENHLEYDQSFVPQADDSWEAVNEYHDTAIYEPPELHEHDTAKYEPPQLHRSKPVKDYETTDDLFPKANTVAQIRSMPKTHKELQPDNGESTDEELSASLQRKHRIPFHDAQELEGCAGDLLYLNERAVRSTQQTASKMSLTLGNPLKNSQFSLGSSADSSEMVSTHKHLLSKGGAPNKEEAKEMKDTGSGSRFFLSSEKPMRLPQTMPSLAMTMKTMKTCLPEPKECIAVEEPVLTSQAETKLDEMAQPSPTVQEEANNLEYNDINMNQKTTDSSGNSKERNPVQPMPMLMPGMPWQYPSLPLPFSSTIPPLLPTTMPPLNPEALSMTTQLNPNVASQLAAQAQLASMQMMLMQQAMGCLPAMFSPTNQTYSVPQSSLGVPFPSPATLGQSGGDIILPATRPNSIMHDGPQVNPSLLHFNQSNQPVQAGLPGQVGLPSQVGLPGQVGHSPLSATPPIGKGRGRLNRNVHTNFNF